MRAARCLSLRFRPIDPGSGARSDCAGPRATGTTRHAPSLGSGQWWSSPDRHQEGTVPSWRSAGTAKPPVSGGAGAPVDERSRRQFGPDGSGRGRPDGRRYAGKNSPLIQDRHASGRAAACSGDGPVTPGRPPRRDVDVAERHPLVVQRPTQADPRAVRRPDHRRPDGGTGAHRRRRGNAHRSAGRGRPTAGWQPTRCDRGSRGWGMPTTS